MSFHTTPDGPRHIQTCSPWQQPRLESPGNTGLYRGHSPYPPQTSFSSSPYATSGGTHTYGSPRANVYTSPYANPYVSSIRNSQSPYERSGPYHQHNPSTAYCRSRHSGQTSGSFTSSPSVSSTPYFEHSDAESPAFGRYKNASFFESFDSSSAGSSSFRFESRRSSYGDSSGGVRRSFKDKGDVIARSVSDPWAGMQPIKAPPGNRLVAEPPLRHKLLFASPSVAT